MTGPRTNPEDLNDDTTQARPSSDDQSDKRSGKPSDQASDTPSDHDHSTREEAEGRDHARAIRELNDAFRQSFAGGAVLMTAGIINLGRVAQSAILEKVRAFTQFDTGNDPYHEHDFGLSPMMASRSSSRSTIATLISAMALRIPPIPASPGAC